MDEYWSKAYTFSGYTNGSIGPTRLAVYGSMSIGPYSFDTKTWLAEEVKKHQLMGIIHIEDYDDDMHSYNNMNSYLGRVGDIWGRHIEPFAAKIPYMTRPHNNDSHESDTTDYQVRFQMPRNQENPDACFYSFDLGYAHYIILDTHKYLQHLQAGTSDRLQQLIWLKADLKRAETYRKDRPWIFVVSHHAMYCSVSHQDEEQQFQQYCDEEAKRLRNALEHALLDAGVDIYFQTDLSEYARLVSIYDNQKVLSEIGGSQLHHNANAPIYINTGAPGRYQANEELSYEQGIWTSFSSQETGIGTMTVHNATHCQWQFIDTESGFPIDEMWITKNRTRYTNRNQMVIINMETRVITILPFTNPPKIPENFFEQQWEKITAALSAILSFSPVSHSMVELYNAVQYLCNNSQHSQLHEQLERSVQVYLSNRITELHEQSEFVQTVLKIWTDFSEQILTIRSIFLYLERVYMLRECAQRTIPDMCIALLKNELSSKKDIENRLINCILDLIRDERQNEVDHRQDLRELVRMTIELDLYKENCEPVFLEATKSYYKEQSDKIVDSIAVAEYLVYSENKIKEERERIMYYMHPSTLKPGISVLQEVLIKNNAERLLKGGFKQLMDFDRINDLSRMYRLFSDIGDDEMIVNAHRLYVQNRGWKLIKDHGEKCIEHIITFKRKIDNLLEGAFLNDKKFSNANKQGWEKFLNRQANQTSELLAKYSDQKLNRRAKHSLTSIELERALDEIIEIFKHVLAKDVFETFYCKYLSKRLLFDCSASNDAEKSMIGKLKTECGGNFTMRIANMYKDIEISNTLLESYHEKNQTDISVKIYTLSLGTWPIPSQFKTTPEVLLPIQKTFEDFYSTKHTGRVLRWQSSMGFCELRAVFPAGNKNIVVSQHQAAILLLFNDAESLSIEEIATQTQLPCEEIRRELAALACAKYKILKKSSEGRNLAETEDITVNKRFRCKLFKIKINQLQLKTTKEEDEDTRARIVMERAHIIDAAVVRIMKARKFLAHQDLMTETFSQLRFPIEAMDVKKRIESLIEREFLRRDENKTNSYHYIP